LEFGGYLRHIYRFFKELFKKMVSLRILVGKVLCGTINGALKNHFFEGSLRHLYRFFEQLFKTMVL